MPTGLNSAQVHALRKKHGLNVLKAVKSHSIWRKIFDQFTDLMVIILIISAVIAISFGIFEGEKDGLVDGLVILGIVVLNAAIGFFQEFKTEKALEALNKLVAPLAVVIRDGKKHQIKAQEIVPGDIVVLAPGDRIPADGVLLESSELKAEESALTGESVPVSKAVHEEVFMGTTVAAGVGLMKVSSIGMETQFGKIAHLTTTTVQEKSPLQKELFHVGVFVTKVTLIISGVLVITGFFWQGKGLLESLLFAVAVAVAAVPEGLPATITVALALGIQKLIKRRAVMKKLSSVETLGSTTVICSDKTGTLTKNEMTVTKVLLGTEEVLKVSGSGYDPTAGEIDKPSAAQKRNLEKMRHISSHCTEAALEKKGKRYSVLGDPTEGSLITLAQKKAQGDKKHPTVTKVKVLKQIPFDSVRKLMSVVTEARGSKTLELWTKGSPDELLERCSHVLYKGKVVTFSAAQKKLVRKQFESMAEQALRVIGFAYRPLKSTEKKKLEGHLEALESKLIFVGLAGMIDPPREAVPKAVEMCHQAGIRTIIITGDHGLTAKAIAGQVGIADDQTPVILGVELEQMKDAELDQILKDAQEADPRSRSLIFSRVNPEHKRRIVDRLKRQGEVVAVTGDGVNDAPALKRADLGIAMGITGTEVSKETANMILLDDSFASIVTAIREGRKIYSNLRKFTWFIFSCNIGELVTVFSAIILQIPAPLTATLILAIDLGTDILPAIALGVDHGEPGIMDKPPRDQKVRMMNRRFVLHFVGLGLFIGLVVVSVYLWKLMSLGWTFGEDLPLHNSIHNQAATLAFATLVVIQLFNAFNARSFEYSIFKLRRLNVLWGATAVSVLMVLAFVYLPFFHSAFRTAPLAMSDWLLVLWCGVLVVLVEEVRKYVMSFHLRKSIP